MALPTNLSTGLVTGQYLVAAADGADADLEPDGIAASGTITFTASIPYNPDPTANPNPVTVLYKKITGVLDAEGYLCTPLPGTLDPAYRGVRLLATDDPDLSVADWTWNAAYKFDPVDGSTLAIPTHSFAVLAGAVADLTTLAKVPSSTGLGTEQAEALAASATAAALAAADDAAAATQAAETAAGAAQVTDANISALVADPGTDTGAAVVALVGDAAADKLSIEDAAGTYVPVAGFGAALAAQATTGGTPLNGVITDAVAPKLDATVAETTYAGKGVETSKLDKNALDAESAALVNNPLSAWWTQLLVWLKTIFLGKREIVVSVTEFGAKGDYVSPSNKGTDNLAAFDAAFAYAASITGYAVKLYIPAGKWRLSGPWKTYRSSASSNTLTIEGSDQLSTFLVADFFGSGLDLMSVADPAGSSRASATNIRRLQYTYVSLAGPTPVYLNILGGGESRYEELRFNSGNNTHFRASSLQNVRMRDIVSFYGGHHFNYKATDAITFDVTAGGAVTASAPIFSAADVTKVFSIFPATEDQRIKYTISAVTDSTHATVTIGTGGTIIAATAAKGYFEAAAGAVTAGQTQFVADAPCFTTDDVGRVIYIRGARAGSWGAGNLRAKIAAYVSATEVTLDTPAGVTVTRAPFTAPAVDFYTTPGAPTLAADSNDVKIDLLHIENNYGVGLCTAPNVFFHIDKMKIHGEHDPIDARHSTAAMWLDDYAGTINGELDGAATGDARVHICGMNDTLTFEWLATRRVRGETIFKVDTMTDPKGFVEVKTFISYKTTTSGNPYDLVADPNAQPRLVFTGLVNMLGDSLPPRIYLAKDAYITPQGALTLTAGGNVATLSGANGGRLVLEDQGTKKYSMGNTAGGGTSFTITDESLALVRLLIASTGAITPGVDNTQAFGTSGARWSEVVATKYTMGATGITRTTGTGTPEGVVTAPVGSEYINVAGAAGAIKYGKKTGTGNTG